MTGQLTNTCSVQFLQEMGEPRWEPGDEDCQGRWNAAGCVPWKRTLFKQKRLIKERKKMKFSRKMLSVTLIALGASMLLCACGGEEALRDKAFDDFAPTYDESPYEYSFEEEDDDGRKEYVAADGRRYYFGTDTETGNTVLYRSKNSEPDQYNLTDPESWDKYKIFYGDDIPTLEELGIE